MKMNARAGKLMVQVLFLLLLTDLALSEANSRLPARLLAKQTGAAQFEEHIEQPIRPDCNEHRHRLRKRSSDEDLDYEVYQGVVGRPGIDFPIFPRIPQTTFSCRSYGNGYFADLETSCQVFHICEEGRKISFLCPNGTIFQQSELTCDWWFKVNCAGSPGFYAESAEILHKARRQRVKPTAVYKGFTNNKVAELLPTGKPFKKSDRRIDSNENRSIESLDFEDISDDRSTERPIKTQSRGNSRGRNRSNEKLKIPKNILLSSSAPESPIHQHNEHELQITAETSSFVKDPRQNSYTGSEKTLNKERESGHKNKEIQPPKTQSIVRTSHRNDFHQKQKTGKKIEVNNDASRFITVRPNINEVTTSDDGLRADLETPDEGGVPSQIILVGNNEESDTSPKQKAGKRIDGFYITSRPEDIGSSTAGKSYYTTAQPDTYKNRNSLDNADGGDKQFVTPSGEDRKHSGSYSTLKPDFFANEPLIKGVTPPSVYPGTYSTARRIDSTRTTPFYTPTVPTVLRTKPTDSKSLFVKVDQPTTFRGALATESSTPKPAISERAPNSEVHRFPVYSNGELKVQLPVFTIEPPKSVGQDFSDDEVNVQVPVNTVEAPRLNGQDYSDGELDVQGPVSTGERRKSSGNAGLKVQGPVSSGERRKISGNDDLNVQVPAYTVKPSKSTGQSYSDGNRRTQEPVTAAERHQSTGQIHSEDELKIQVPAYTVKPSKSAGQSYSDGNRRAQEPVNTAERHQSTGQIHSEDKLKIKVPAYTVKHSKSAGQNYSDGNRRVQESSNTAEPRQPTGQFHSEDEVKIQEPSYPVKPSKSAGQSFSNGNQRSQEPLNAAERHQSIGQTHSEDELKIQVPAYTVKPSTSAGQSYSDGNRRAQEPVNAAERHQSTGQIHSKDELKVQVPVGTAERRKSLGNDELKVQVPAYTFKPSKSAGKTYFDAGLKVQEPINSAERGKSTFQTFSEDDLEAQVPAFTIKPSKSASQTYSTGPLSEDLKLEIPGNTIEAPKSASRVYFDDEIKVQPGPRKSTAQVHFTDDLSVQLRLHDVEEPKLSGLTLTTSTSGPTYLPKGTERSKNAPVTPASIAKVVSQNIKGILDTVGVIKETMKTNFDEKIPGGRAGLDIPPSSGPGTLISLTNYFGNDDGQDGQTGTTVSSEEDTPSTIAPVDISASLLSNKTSGKYLSLFGLNKDDGSQEDQEVTATTTSPKTVSGPTVVGDFTRTTIKDLAQNPETRKIAQVFSNAITKYIENPETFRKDLIDVRPTAPPLSANSVSDTINTTPSYFSKGGTVTVSILADTTYSDGILGRGVTQPYAQQTTTERYESPTTQANDIAKEINNQFDGTTPSYDAGSTESTEATTYRGRSFSTARPKSHSGIELSSELLPPSNDEETEHESLHKVQSQSFVKSYNDLTKSPKAIAFDRNTNNFESSAGKATTTSYPWSKSQKDKVATTENPLSYTTRATFDATTDRDFLTTTNQVDSSVKATVAPWIQSKNKPLKPVDPTTISPQGSLSAKSGQKPWNQPNNKNVVISLKSTGSGSGSIKPTENPWSQITHSIYLDPLTINDGLMREPKPTTFKPFDFVNTDRSRFEDVSENEESIEDLLNSPELSSELLPKNNGLQRIANKLFGGLNETEAIHLKNVMKKAEHNQSVLRLLLLLIQTCDDQDGKALEKSRKILLNALIGMDSKLKSKTHPQLSVTTTNKIPVTTYRRNQNDSPTTILTPTTTDISEDSTKFEIRVADMTEDPSTSVSSEHQSATLDNPNRTSDQRALELLKSLYSLASKFSRR